MGVRRFLRRLLLRTCLVLVLVLSTHIIQVLYQVSDVIEVCMRKIIEHLLVKLNPMRSVVNLVTDVPNTQDDQKSKHRHTKTRKFTHKILLRIQPILGGNILVVDLFQLERKLGNTSLNMHVDLTALTCGTYETLIFSLAATLANQVSR